MELDQHEFLNYIIPSVNAGLSVKKYDHNATSFPPYILETLRASQAQETFSSQTQHGHSHYVNHHGHPPPHHHHHHVHHAHHPSWNGNRSDSDADESLRRMKGTASHNDVLLKTSLKHSQSEHGSTNFASDGRPNSLVASHSESDLVGTMSKSSQRQMCVLKVADTVKWTIPSEEGQLVWANAAVTNTGVSDDEFTAAAVHELLALRSMPLDWIAPQISTYFASQLKQDAVKRPLSLRSIDFLSKSTLVWGKNGATPAVLNGFVSLEMFAAFWHWFAPLTECIQYSRLWSFTQPRLLHGFLSKGTCVNMLQRAPPGTFLLRFSETRQRCFVIAYVHEDGCVQFVPVTCKQEDGWCVALQDDTSGVTFPTIQDLILSVSVLKFLFPQTPKELAFHIH